MGNHQRLFKVKSGFNVRQQLDIMLAVFKKCNVLLSHYKTLAFLNYYIYYIHQDSQRYKRYMMDVMDVKLSHSMS